MIVTILFFYSNTFTNTHSKFVSGYKKPLLPLGGRLSERVGNLSFESRPWPDRAHFYTASQLCGKGCASSRSIISLHEN